MSWSDLALNDLALNDLALNDLALNLALRPRAQIRDPENLVRRKTYAACKPRGVSKLSETGSVFTYLTSERTLTKGTVEAFRVAQTATEVSFPSYDPSGVLVNVKHLGLVANRLETSAFCRVNTSHAESS